MYVTPNSGPDWLKILPIIISSFALAVAGVSAYFSRTSARAAILGRFVDLEKGLHDVKGGALKFHGISDEEFMATGLTPEQFSYLLANTTLGSFYHRLLDPWTETAFEPRHYRRRMCESADFQKAWPVLRKLITPSNFTERLEATFKELGVKMPPDEE